MAFNDDFQACESMLRFEVTVDDMQVEAFLSQATCNAAPRPMPQAQGLAGFYLQHRPVLHETVQHKVRAGARHPVVLMARDLQVPLAAERR
jgi:hypothetical protein